MMKIAVGSNHVGIELKPTIIEYLKELGHEVEEFGSY
ncbi:ribose-5-phosphate isomerase B [Clostridioides difficile]|nr:ribose-5-phosphate isomerase B [Clostridioides difficile]SJP35754.1 ribose-5-phosphate isomerase B [Clostridioides difficile]SJS94915.1 ribose-5-phosphate isomerase B [Clostridioides difficile]